MKYLENILVFFCKLFLGTVKIISSIFDGLAKILSVILFVIAFRALWTLVGKLPVFWQSLIIQVFLITGSLSFLALITLAIWRPKTFDRIFKK
ncbi:MAG: hypothetical protein PHT40_03520 [Patescibacteria group bacterium]|nr:hypothetical protein [Patescibacteria group bacterium]